MRICRAKPFSGIQFVVSFPLFYGVCKHGGNVRQSSYTDRVTVVGSACHRSEVSWRRLHRREFDHYYTKGDELMKCPACNTGIVDDAAFCHKCGGWIRSDRSKGADLPEVDGSDRHDISAVERLGNKINSLRASDDSEERELWTGTFSPKAMLGAWIVSFVVSLALVTLAVLMWNYVVTCMVVVVVAMLWIYQLIVLAKRRFGIFYRLTSQRFSHETGILRHKTDLIEVIDMDDIGFEQSLIGRFIGVGNIQIHSSDRTHPELWIRGVENVKEVAQVMHEARHAERLKRGLHIESL